MRAVAVVARLTWLRLRRGRTWWITGLLLLLPVVLALALPGHRFVEGSRWRIVVETTLRLLVVLAAAIHLAPAVGEEIDGKTYTFLWSRPMPRWALLVGKLIATTPVLIVAFAVALAAAYPIAVGDAAAAAVPTLGRAIGAAAAGVIAASAVALGAGALFPKHPFVVVLAYFLAVEQILQFVPVVGNLSIFYHLGAIAELPTRGAGTHGTGAALGALVILSMVWMGLGVWRVETAEYAKADR